MPKPPAPDPEQGLQAGRSLSEADVVLPLAAAICIIIGWTVILDYESVILPLAASSPSIGSRVQLMRLVMGLLSIGGLGLALLAARNGRRRREAEAALLLAHDALSQRMARRTDLLRTRTRALRESRLRERLAETEAEAAYAAGQVEAAGAYLHGVGNAISAMDLELLRLSRALAAAPRLDAAFAAVAESLRGSQPDRAEADLESLRQTLLDRAMPRLAAGIAAVAELKDRMAADLERHRGEFERRDKREPYLQDVRLDEELAAILDRMPRAAGSDPVAREIAPGLRLRTRKQPFLAALAALVRQALDAAVGGVTVRLYPASGGRAVLVVEGASLPGGDVGPVAAGINFLNENGGAVRQEPATASQPPRLVIEMAGQPTTSTDPSAGLS
ncbi:MAG: hypothetical protein B193_2966 [Solidesulfovibrio magneticus str. Maddingley MBC34]|uniref:Uncharacterized protein n=1 Tax=Solidesulfovibrio magneticus str. Maddingley MBC34 TaxID=1206767 RepID=K6FI90_9BACT|nr:MAG: hypothetical protein B193_2966 [Solidesulfovibrio magneticus str. Maddingley MBC34]